MSKFHRLTTTCRLLCFQQVAAGSGPSRLDQIGQNLRPLTTLAAPQQTSHLTQGLEQQQSCGAHLHFRPTFHSYQQRAVFNFPSAVESKKYTERRLIGYEPPKLRVLVVSVCCCPFHKLSWSIVIRYSPQQLYTVVSGIEHYKDFVPWCVRSEVLDRPSADYLEAELEVGFKLFTERQVCICTLIIRCPASCLMLLQEAGCVPTAGVFNAAGTRQR